jgi:hypothetical protein
MRTVLVGPVGYDDIIRHLDQVARADAFGCAEIIDTRGTDGPPPSLSELRRLAAHARDLMGRGRPGPRAIIVDTAINQLVSELFSIFMSGPMRIEVFTSESGARKWLREQLDRSAPPRESVGTGVQASS